MAQKMVMQTNLIFLNGDVNSLTAMDAHERPLFIERRGTVVSRRVFIRSQSLIAR
jgi:hypothetical protein